MPQGYTLEQLQQMGKVKPSAPAQGGGLTLQQLQEMGVVKPSTPTYAQDAVSDIKEAGTGIVEGLKKRGSELADTAKQTWNRTINPVQTGIRTVGSLIGGAGDIIGGAAMGIGKALLPQSAETAIAESAPVQAVGSAMRKYQEWEQQNPEIAKDINAVANIASVIPAEKALGLAGRAATGIETAAKATGEKIAETTAETVAKATGAMKPVQNAAGILKSKLESGAQFVKNAPERLDVTAQAVKKEAAETALEKPVVQKAAQSGFTRKEASTIANATPREKMTFRKMKMAAENESAGKKIKQSSADIAGEKFQERIGEAEAIRKQAGKELGEAVKGLKGEVVSVRHKALARLQEELGERISIDNKGNLDFSGTRLASSDNAAARARVNSLWNDLKGKDAFELHELRGEMFESQGGRAKAKVVSTSTEDDAVEALRSGIADALEEVSPDYRAINAKYAKVMEPLKKLRKFYRDLPDAGDDILNERGSVLMRRLTSNSPSAQNIKQAIAEIDAVLKSYGKKSFVDLEKLQMFQNLLEREYTDIVAETGLAGQGALAIRKGVPGLLEMGAKALGEMSGNTPAYRRKLLDEMLLLNESGKHLIPNIPKTVRVWIKSKFSDSGDFADIPVLGREEKITLYQGQNAGEKRQFWTPNKKYAEQFGPVRKKTGSFYRVDNGNRMTDVYVEAP